MDELKALQLANNELDALRSRLEGELASRNQLVKSLEAELEETNRGVVALYAELDNYSEQLRQASDLKSRFLTYMSHEFRTPLGAIQSISQILLQRLDGPLTEEQVKQIKFVEKAAVELTDMVNDLLDLAKVEAGRVAIAPAWFDMVDLFSAIRGLFKPIIAHSEVSLIFDDPNDVPRLYTDDSKLSIILRNLVSNALKFTLQGEVRVSVKAVDGQHVAFAVRDTGIGIAQQYLPTIFDDWIQVQSTTQRRLRGSGLGLSLCRRYAELLGGNVSVESELAVGSTFTLQIPRVLAGYVESIVHDNATGTGGLST